ncbi:MAG: TetR/AcrR family transcriptional regulator [Rhodoferax sp.]|nr:TetR/AcrR family transcriptional regulator [Rhodoferax sp.]
MNSPACPLDHDCATAPKRERRKDARPRELLDAALALFVEQGFAATKVEDVARRAGVSKGTLFLYFATKEELFKAVVRENIVGQFSEFNVALDSFTGTTETLLRTFMTAWWHRVGCTRSAGICKLMVSEGRQFPELADFYRTEVIDPACQIIGRVLARGVQRGELQALPAPLSIYTLLAPILFLMLWNSAPSLSGALALDGEAFLDTQIDVLLHGIAVRQPVANPNLTSIPPSAPTAAA